MNYKEQDAIVYAIEQHTEINYIPDCEVFFDDNNLNIEDYKKYTFILFEFTSDYVELIESLESNNIKYTKETDEWGLDYILI